MPGYLGCFIDSLAAHCESLLLFQHLPSPGENVQMDYEIKSPNVKLISLPPRGSVPHRFLQPHEYTRMIQSHAGEIDALLMRGPSPLIPAIQRAIPRSPTILLIVGDYLAGVNSLPQPIWRKELIRAWSWIYSQGQMKAAKKSLVFVNSRELYNQFENKIPNLVETRTTTLISGDFFSRTDTCLSRPVKLLYTGRMDPAKGLLDMVEAVALLVDAGEDVVLNLVGWPEKGATIIEEILQLSKKRKIASRVNYLGFKAVGPELFKCYREADIYLMASQTSEGFPRTIWEAMANSLPVVATRVGGMPNLISGMAELVDPKKPQKLAQGIQHVIQNSDMRQSYIAKGFSLAKGNTLEYRASEMVREIKLWLGSEQ